MSGLGLSGVACWLQNSGTEPRSWATAAAAASRRHNAAASALTNDMQRATWRQAMVASTQGSAATTHLHERRPQRLPCRPVDASVHELLRLHLIGDKALAAEPALAVARTSKVARAARQQRQRQAAAKDADLCDARARARAREAAGQQRVVRRRL